MTEIGIHILNFQRVSRHFSVRRKQSTFRRINSLLHMENDIGPGDVLKVVSRLAKCLGVLHSSSLFVGNLNMNTVCLGVTDEKVLSYCFILLSIQILPLSLYFHFMHPHTFPLACVCVYS